MMRVFIADDEEIIRDGIRNCIEKEQERFLFAGEAPDGEMALPMLMEMKPDVLITDIRMPFMDGLEPVSYTHLRDESGQSGAHVGHIHGRAARFATYRHD